MLIFAHLLIFVDAVAAADDDYDLEGILDMHGRVR
jgi:hypothetical protein